MVTKKSLKEALTPLRRETERYACRWMATGRSDGRPAPIEFAGHTVEIALVRRGFIVPRVPAPYNALEFWYYLNGPDGKHVVGATSGGSFVDAATRYLNKQERTCQ